MIVGYTPGGSPIFHNSGKTKRAKNTQRLSCTCCHHKTTGNQAKANGYLCHQCGSALKIRASKIAELHALQKAFGVALSEVKP